MGAPVAHHRMQAGLAEARHQLRFLQRVAQEPLLEAAAVVRVVLALAQPRALARARGSTSERIALGDLGPSFAAVVGRADVDFSLGAPAGSNEDELVAIVGSNAAGYNLGVFGIGSDGCAFQFDDGAAGSPYIIPVHAAVATTSGLRCDGGMGSRFMVRLEANSSDGVNYTTNDIRVERTDGNSLADGVSIPGTITSADAGFMAYQQAECDGVLFVGGGADF